MLGWERSAAMPIRSTNPKSKRLEAGCRPRPNQLLCVLCASRVSTQRGRWPQPKTNFSVYSVPLQAPTHSTQRRSVISVFHLYFGPESTEKNLRGSRRNSVLVTEDREDLSDFCG